MQIKRFMIASLTAATSAIALTACANQPVEVVKETSVEETQAPKVEETTEATTTSKEVAKAEEKPTETQKETTSNQNTNSTSSNTSNKPNSTTSTSKPQTTTSKPTTSNNNTSQSTSVKKPSTSNTSNKTNSNNSTSKPQTTTPKPTTSNKPTHTHSYKPVYKTVEYYVTSDRAYKTTSTDKIWDYMEKRLDAGTARNPDGTTLSWTSIWEDEIDYYKCSCGAKK